MVVAAKLSGKTIFAEYNERDGLVQILEISHYLNIRSSILINHATRKRRPLYEVKNFFRNVDYVLYAK